MSFDALTIAGVLSALLAGGFLIGLASKSGANRPRRRKPGTSEASR